MGAVLMAIYVIPKKTEVEKKLGIKSASEEHLKWCGVDPVRIWHMEEIDKLFDAHSEELMELFQDITKDNFVKYLLKAMTDGGVVTPEEGLELLFKGGIDVKKP